MIFTHMQFISFLFINNKIKGTILNINFRKVLLLHFQMSKEIHQDIKAYKKSNKSKLR